MKSQKGKPKVAAASIKVRDLSNEERYDVCTSEMEILATGIEGVKAGPGGYCLPRHRMPFNSRNEGSRCIE